MGVVSIMVKQKIQKVVRKSTLFLMMLLSGIAHAAEPVSTGWLNNAAIGKHDTAAYHLNKAAEKGDKRFAHEWQGAKWYFATAEQRDLFAADPEKYSPAYNGFCSNALTLGEGLIGTDGSVWHIFGDQLHLFYAERGRQRWLKEDYAALKAVADAAWQKELAEYQKK